MLRLSKFAILVILGGCYRGQPVTNRNHLETVTNHHELENDTYDYWSFPKCKKLFEIKIK